MAARRATALLLLALAWAAAGCGTGSQSSPGAATTGMSPPRVARYDLGVRRFPQPLAGRFAQMPVRLRGVIAVPAGSGPFPVVVLAHGSHGDNCPAGAYDSETWPCWDRETRSDLGLEYLAEGLARRGFVAVSPNVNAAFTAGWGEPLGELRWGQVIDATLAALATAQAGGPDAFGVPLTGRLDLFRIGVAGHSRSGALALAWAAHGGGPVSGLLLVAPAWLGATDVPNVPIAMVESGCDGDVGADPGREYLALMRAQADRTAPFVLVTLGGADHVSFNRLLADAGRSDPAPVTTPSCSSGRRLPAASQQAWLTSFAGDVVDQALTGRAATWMEGPPATTLFGHAVRITRVSP